jgi:hypothetical protein
MSAGKILLVTDACINLLLGALLLCYSRPLAEFLGVPWTAQRLYPNLLGGVLFGIGLALLIEIQPGPNTPRGLGLAGAIAINLSGGLVLTTWLLWGNLDLPLRGKVLLWGMAFVLVVLSSLEGIAHLQRRAGRGR